MVFTTLVYIVKSNGTQLIILILIEASLFIHLKLNEIG